MADASAVLEAREERWQRRLHLARTLKCTVVCCALVVPGSEKHPAWADGVLEALCGELHDAFERQGICFSEVEDSVTADGRYKLLAVYGDSHEIKRCCVSVEEASRVGRLADFDVMCEKGTVIGRAELGLAPRTCLLCSAPAAVCVRARRHSLHEIQMRVNTLVTPYCRERGVSVPDGFQERRC